MEFKPEAGVFTVDGKEVGKLDRVVIEPKTKSVTHLVVRKGLIQKESYVVPIDRVETATEEQIVLREDTDPLESYPQFQETAYIQVPQGKPGRQEPKQGYPSSVYLYTPVGTQTMQYSGYPVTARPEDRKVDDVARENIPEGTVALKEGARVLDEEGEHVGDVERVYFDSEKAQLSHLMISQGLLFKGKKIIPASWIDRVAEKEVWLAVGREVLERVPDHKENDIPGGYA